MKTITREEFDRLGAAAVLRLVEEGKESVGLIDSKTGRVAMVLPYRPPREACRCTPSARMWECLSCDGFVEHDADRSANPQVTGKITAEEAEAWCSDTERAQRFLDAYDPPYKHQANDHWVQVLAEQFHEMRPTEVKQMADAKDGNGGIAYGEGRRDERKTVVAYLRKMGEEPAADHIEDGAHMEDREGIDANGRGAGHG